MPATRQSSEVEGSAEVGGTAERGDGRRDRMGEMAEILVLYRSHPVPRTHFENCTLREYKMEMKPRNTLHRIRRATRCQPFIRMR